MDFIDLHIHTTASDGSFTPEQVVNMALETGLYAIAITDHDTIDGVAPAMEAAEGKPLRIISGVEISSTYNGRDVHILGYNIDIENSFLIKNLNAVRNMREDRNAQMCALLQEHGMDITMEELYSRSTSRTLTRGSMGHLMIEKGYVKDMNEAFAKYLSKNAEIPCYVPRFKMTVEDAYKLINYAGGVCVVAHPVRYKMSDEQYYEMFRAFKRIGLKCIEAIHSDNKTGDEEKFTQMARDCNLKITGGSDFHGASKPAISIGTGRGNIRVPKALLKNIGISDF